MEARAAVSPQLAQLPNALTIARLGELDVNLVGKAATWVLYAAIFFRIVTHQSTQWPLDLFWAGIALALAAGVLYIRTAWGELRR